MEFHLDGAPAPSTPAARHTEPRLFTLAEAAQYLNLPKAEVRRLGIGRIPLGTRLRYDRNAIDAELDRLSGLDSTESTRPDDAEAALARFTQGLRDAPRRP